MDKIPLPKVAFRMNGVTVCPLFIRRDSVHFARHSERHGWFDHARMGCKEFANALAKLAGFVAITDWPEVTE